MATELKVLKSVLKGPILRVEDPYKHTTEDIMSSYFREIMWLARRYIRPAVEYEDLVVEGLMGLLDAIRRWDPEKARGNPASFHNLAIVRIKSNMFEYFLANNTRYTVPNYMSRAMSLVEQTRSLINSHECEEDPRRALLNYEAPLWEAAAADKMKRDVNILKMKIKRLAENAGRTYEKMVVAVLKIEANINSYENSELNSGTQLNVEDEAAQKEFLSKFLGALNPAAKDVIEYRLNGLTLDEAGQEKGFTRERARQIERDTLKYFKETRMYKDAIEE